jgi:hypothetical protein
VSWHPNDLVSDADLLAYEPTIHTQFGRVEWTDKRTKALEDWLWPALTARGFDPDRLRTRVRPTAVLSYTASVFADRTEVATSQAADDLALGAYLTGTSDALYVGHDRPFRGVSLRIGDTPSTATADLAVALWEDAWTPIAIADGTKATVGKSCSRGGAVTWRLPSGWVIRAVNGSDPIYWAKLTVSAALTAGTLAGSLSVLRSSLFRAPVTYKTLEWIFRAAPTSQDGPWNDKAAFYADLAETALQRALEHAGGEFDTVTADDALDAEEVLQTAAEAGGGGWTFERG